MRKFYMADRKRNKASAGLTAWVGRAWSLGLSADYSDDDYSNSEIGLTDGKDYSATLDASYNPMRGLTTHAFYTRQQIKSKQAGSQSFSEPDWLANTTDTFDLLGSSRIVNNIKKNILPKISTSLRRSCNRLWIRYISKQEDRSDS